MRGTLVWKPLQPVGQVHSAGAKVRSARSSGGWPQFGRARDELARRNATVLAKRELETARKGK